MYSTMEYRERLLALEVSHSKKVISTAQFQHFAKGLLAKYLGLDVVDDEQRRTMFDVGCSEEIAGTTNTNVKCFFSRQSTLTHMRSNL